MLLLTILTATLGAYAIGYWSLLAPETCLYASTSGVLRLRHERYRHGGKLLEQFFAPMAFVDLMIRETYWMQKDVSALQLESPELADQLPLVERIGSIGGLVIWDSSRVTVSFLGRAVSDDALAVFEDFVLVDDLNLADTGVSDAGLDRLTKLDRLRHLNVDGTQVSDAAIKRLKLALPKCFVWNGK